MWYVNEWEDICFNINDLYVYEISKEAILKKTLEDWIFHLEKKVWFRNKEGFINIYLGFKRRVL